MDNPANSPQVAKLEPSCVAECQDKKERAPIKNPAGPLSHQRTWGGAARVGSLKRRTDYSHQWFQDDETCNDEHGHHQHRRHHHGCNWWCCCCCCCCYVLLTLTNTLRWHDMIAVGSLSLNELEQPGCGWCERCQRGAGGAHGGWGWGGERCGRFLAATCTCYDAHCFGSTLCTQLFIVFIQIHAVVMITGSSSGNNCCSSGGCSSS